MRRVGIPPVAPPSPAARSVGRAGCRAATHPTPRAESQRGRPTWTRWWGRGALDARSCGRRRAQIERSSLRQTQARRWRFRLPRRCWRATAFGATVTECDVPVRYVCTGVTDTGEMPPFLGSATTQNPPPPEGVWVRLPPPVPTQRPRTRPQGFPDVLSRRILRSAMARGQSIEMLRDGHADFGLISRWSRTCGRTLPCPR